MDKEFVRILSWLFMRIDLEELELTHEKERSA
jgi:hypothetical protein